MRRVLVWLLVVGCSRHDARQAPSGAGSSTADRDSSRRLISLTPSATEVVAALGATSLLVGVDEYSLYPPEVRKLPRVGSFLTPNLEIIVKLRPSLVIVDDIHGGAAGALDDAGISTIECAIHTLPDVKRALIAVGDRLERTAQATRAVEEIDAALDSASNTRPAKRPRVLAIIDREAGGLGGLVAAGPGSWVDELLAVVGAENVLAAASVRYPKISMEEVLRGKPDVILDLSYAARGGIAVWNGIDVPAIAHRRVIALADPFLIAPSPRVKAALDVLSNAISTP